MDSTLGTIRDDATKFRNVLSVRWQDESFSRLLESAYRERKTASQFVRDIVAEHLDRDGTAVEATAVEPTTSVTTVGARGEG